MNNAGQCTGNGWCYSYGTAAPEQLLPAALLQQADTAGACGVVRPTGGAGTQLAASPCEWRMPFVCEGECTKPASTACSEQAVMMSDGLCYCHCDGAFLFIYLPVV